MAKRVLIVEDDPKNRRLEKDLLKLAGFEVLEAESGMIALAMIKEEKLDVVVQDLRLPDMRGTEIAHALRENPQTCHVPVIFVTASVIGDGGEEAKGIHRSIFITKPINTRTFAQEVVRFMEGM